MRAPLLSVVISACVVAGVAVHAQNAAPALGAPDPARISGGTYAVDGHHTQVMFGFNHMGVTNNMGVFGSATGSLTLDPKNAGQAKVEVTIPINSISTGVADFTHHLQSPDLFDAAKFPAATFKSTSVKVNGTKAVIAGDLTIKGITKPVTLDASFVGAGVNPMSQKETVGFSATTTIKRSDFGLGYGVPVVGDDVELKISAGFEK